MDEQFRIDKAGDINRERPVQFMFDGKSYIGYEGDTLASAMIANGISLTGRSFKFHRPRGVFTDGLEEPNTLVQLGSRAAAVPNTQATQVELYDGLIASSQNCWPSLQFDISSIFQYASALLPAGFYNKTFKWPRNFLKYYEPWLRKAAGMGCSPVGADPDQYDQVNIYTDILIIGAGPAGMMAADTAAITGCRVLVVEHAPWLGGRCAVEGNEVGGKKPRQWVDDVQAALAKRKNVTILTRTTAVGSFESNYVYCVERVNEHLPPAQRASQPRQRMWRARAKEIILATGALERPLVFKNNDRPGIMLASSVCTYLCRFSVLPGQRTILFTNNDSAYETAETLICAGGQVVVIVDTRRKISQDLLRKTKEAGVRVINSGVVTDVQGKQRITGVSVRRFANDTNELEGKAQRFECDLLACSGGWNPTVHLFSQAGGTLRYDIEIASYVADNSSSTMHCIGAVAGIFDLDKCLHNGITAGIQVAGRLGYKVNKLSDIAAQRPSYTAYKPGPVIMPVERAADKRKQFIDLQNDVTVSDIGLALREGYTSVEHLKRYTTAGMGTEQGRTSNINALALLSRETGHDLSALGTTTFRPPFIPVTFGVLAGQRRGSAIVPVRMMPLQARHEALAAVFENVGRWRRPACYPRGGEDADRAGLREAYCVREQVGVMEVSPFGKIEVKGRDAVTFLNRVYTNSFDSLQVGCCRYGVILNEYGTIYEDGLVMRLGENHFLMSTTSANAEKIILWLEYWLQCEWPELEVYLTDVAEQWAQIVVAGPKSRELLSSVVNINITNERFPHLTLKEIEVAGIPARVFRVSFTGDLAYEIAVPATDGGIVWDTLLASGEGLGVTPYGLIASNILRMEKGYMLVGQDTDGTQTPMDMGMDWTVSKKKPEMFIGKRSLSFPAYQRPDRKQFVGLLTEDPAHILPTGIQVMVSSDVTQGNQTVCGHVTSSQFSVASGRSMALALIENGRKRKGEPVSFKTGDRTVTATIVRTCFFDVQGERLRG